MQNANHRCTGHATMSTERAHDRLITEHVLFLSCYRAKPKCNFAVLPLCDRYTMLGLLLQTVWVCLFGEETKTKYWLEFAKMFETMFGVELLDGYKRAVCDECRYSIFW